MQWLLTILICLCFSVEVKAQTSYFHFEEHPPNEIKLNAGVIKAYQDHLGYLWFCGFDGISRYNGSAFESIESLYPKTSEIEIKHFRSIFINSDNSIWLCSYGSGLFKISSDSEVENFNSLVSNGQKLPSNVIKDVVIVGGQVWVLGSFGLRVYEKDGLTYELQSIDDLQDPAEIKEIFSFDDGNVWMRDEDSVYRFMVAKNQLKVFGGFQQSKISKDKFGNIWINKREDGNYLYQLDKETDVFTKNLKQPFASINENLNIAWDFQHRVWAAQFDSQIYMGDMISGKLEISKNDQHNLRLTQFTRQPLIDNSGAVWLINSSCYMLPYSTGFNPIYLDATDEKAINKLYIDDDYIVLGVLGEGLVVYDRKTGKQKKYTENNSQLANPHVSFIKHLGEGKFALGLLNYFHVFDIDKGFIKTIRTNGVVRSIADDEDFFWVGSINDLMRISKKDFSDKHYHVKTIEGRSRNSIHRIIPKDDKHLWIFGATNGVQLFHKESGAFIPDPILTNQKDEPLVFSKIVDADESPSGDYFSIATESGLYVYSKKTKELKFLDIGKRFIKATQFQSDTILWTSVDNDLIRCNCLSLECKQYGKQHGLINETFRVRSRYKSPSGEIYFGGNKGIDVVPTIPIKTNQFGPSLQIGKLLVNRADKIDISQNEIVEIPPEAKIAEIYVDAMHFSHGDAVNVEYKYKADTTWNPLKFGDQLTLINPKPGKHSIDIRAQNSDGIYNENEVTINIDFLEIWYNSFWFKWLLGTFVMSVLLLSFWVYNRQKRNQLKRRFELTTEINQLKLHALNAQMNPHFVFNAMSSIQQMIGAKDNKMAMEYLSKFSRLLRHVIHYSSETTVFLNEELKFIENYLQLEQARFHDLFDYEVNIDESLEEDVVKIPAFFIQPQIENAIKHGFRNSERKGFISIDVIREGGFIKVLIKDNGIGRKRSQLINSMSNDNTNKGIELTQKRIKQLNSQGYESTYIIEDIQDNEGNVSGTKVILTFKLMNI